ncbi:MAG TPA: DUF2520 domain-containing protein [Ruminococcus sp.]|nr:DUF2520 domain-containing protein [Ruminococcus sp.]
MKTGFIGAGKVGFSLGKYLLLNGINISGYMSRNPESAQKAAEFTSSELFTDYPSLIADSDIIFITVTDGNIKSVFNEMKKYDISGKLICHCSGAMTANEAFSDISEHGAYGYSIHPLYPVSDKYESYKGLKDAFFCIEGDEKYLTFLKNLFENIGNNVRIIPTETKKEYHAACAVSSNLVCGLIAESISLMEKCGFTEKDALSALRPLAFANMNKIFETSPSQALTGAVERCDTETIKKHLNCIKNEDERNMYRAVSLMLVGIAQRKHPETDYTEMTALLK